MASPTTADGGGDGGTDAGVEVPTEAGVAEGEVEGAEPWLAVAGRLTNALADALADEEDEGEAGEEQVGVSPVSRQRSYCTLCLSRETVLTLILVIYIPQHISPAHTEYIFCESSFGQRERSACRILSCHYALRWASRMWARQAAMKRPLG